MHHQPTDRTIAVAQVQATKRWEGTRGKASQESQLRQVLNTLLEVIGPKARPETMKVGNVTIAHVSECVSRWRSANLSCSTIHSRLSVLAVLGIDTSGCWPKNKLPPKWWLKPTDCERLVTYLRQTPPPFLHAELLADYVEFVSHTGLRVEEALRLRWVDVTLSFVELDGGVIKSRSEIEVPGTKTAHSHATRAISTVPALILSRRKEASGGDFVFPIRYDALHELWDKAREFLGVRDNKMATLKALRRTCARHLSLRGMPTEQVKKYLRHSNIETTLGYLDLVGGYSAEEQRKWLA